MTGLLALNGGREHTPGCEDIDRDLLRECGVRQPRVTVLLAATRQGRKAFKIAEAQEYWPRLGAEVQIGFTGRPDDHEHALELLADPPDLIVLTGGFPWLLHERLEGSAVLDRILELWRGGVPLSGSSAGAMALCKWRPQLRPPDPLRMVDAFGLVPGSAAAPHFEHFDMNRFARLVVWRYPHLNAIGLPNRTALIGRDGEYVVKGVGEVTLVRHGEEHSYPSGARLAF